MQAQNKLVNTQKRKRDDAASRMATPRSTARLPPGAMAAESATPLQYGGDDQSLAFEQVLEKVATGEGEEAEMQAQELSALCLRHIKVLKEKNEIEKAVATMKMSRMQAAQRKMAEQLQNREKEILVLKRDLEDRNQYALNLERERGTLRFKLLRLEAELQEQMTSRDSNSDSGYNSDPENHGSDMLRSLKKVYYRYVNTVMMLSNYLYRKLQERTGKRGYTREFLDPLLEGFGILESARAVIRAEYSSNKTLVWEHWISSVVFDGFEDYSLGMEDVSHASTSKSPPNFYSDIRFQHFCKKKYVEFFPPWLLEQFTQSRDAHVTSVGSLKGMSICGKGFTMWPKKSGSSTN